MIITLPPLNAWQVLFLLCSVSLLISYFFAKKAKEWDQFTEAWCGVVSIIFALFALYEGYSGLSLLMKNL